MHVSSESAARDAALAFLYARINYERSPRIPYQERHFKLDRMRRLLAELGNPHRGLPAIHIAGTKGKGSTAAFVASILRRAGYRTGLYTSPHLERLEERFAVDGQMCSAEELVELVERVRPVAEAGDRHAHAAGGPAARATYFELTTAMAFLHFQLRQVDIAVLEVGLGGRLDSTNVCEPLVTAITSISLDHQRQLGATLPEIAAEKAGIIKAGVPLVCGVREPPALEVIQRRGEELACPLRMVDESFFYRFGWREPDRPALANGQAALANGQAALTNGQPAPALAGTLDYWSREQDGPEPRRELRLGLLGAHQASNAATSLAIIDELTRLGWSIPERAIRRGLAEVQCPARVEIVSDSPTTILDAAHNVASCEALAATLRAAFGEQPRTLIFATSQDKDAAGMLRVLLPLFRRVIVTRYRDNPRSVEPARLAALARQVPGDRSAGNRSVAVAPDPATAWRMARSQSESGGLLCATGSFFLAAELRGLVRSTCPDASLGDPVGA